MKKFLQVLLAVAILFFGFGGSSASANDMLLASQQIQKQVPLKCAQLSRVVDEESIQYQPEVEENSIDPRANEVYPREIRTSRNGHTIVLSSGSGASYGYCHIFYRHMIESNGKHGKKATFGDKPSQFQYARYPDSLMDIAMQVINSGAREEVAGTGGRLKKTITSSKEGQTVEVVYAKTRDWGSGRYAAYDYVIISMYPKF